MNPSENKNLMQRIFSGLSEGNSQLFFESMADDFCWTLTGTTKWSKTYSGKQAVIDKLIGPLRAKLEGRIRTTARRFIADGEFVVVEAQGNNRTKTGAAYNNTYCYVFRLEGGKLKEMTEYFDTELVTSALGDPDSPSASSYQIVSVAGGS